MTISDPFNRYHHGAVLREAFAKLDFVDWIVHDPETGEKVSVLDVETGDPMRFIKDVDYFDMEDFKQLLKIIDIHYPRRGDGRPKSTRDLTSEEVAAHENFVAQLLIDNGFEPSF